MILSELPVVRPGGLWQADELLGTVRGDKAFKAENDGRGAAGFAEQAPKVRSEPVAAAIVAQPPASAPALLSTTPAEALAAPVLMPADARVATPAIEMAIDNSLLQQQRDAGYAEGLEAGRQAMRVEMRTEIEKEKQAARKLLTELRNALGDSRTYFAPLEQLAVHLAGQLVRGELTLSSVAIRRLVENCLLEIDHRGEKVTLRLHPEDLEKFSLLPGELPEGVELRSDPALARGSVRLEMADGAIEDLIEHRLATLARSLGVEAAAQIERGEGAQMHDEVARHDAGDDGSPT